MPCHSIYTTRSDSSVHIASQANMQLYTNSNSTSSITPDTQWGHPHDRNSTQSRSVRDDTDKEHASEAEYVCEQFYYITQLTECTVRFLDKCWLNVRWINIAICFGVDVHNVFKVDMQLTSAETHNSKTDLDM